MIPAIIIEVDLALVFRLLRQILYPENEQDDQRGGNGGGGERSKTSYYFWHPQRDRR